MVPLLSPLTGRQHNTTTRDRIQTQHGPSAEVVQRLKSDFRRGRYGQELVQWDSCYSIATMYKVRPSCLGTKRSSRGRTVFSILITFWAKGLEWVESGWKGDVFMSRERSFGGL
jgi:hypothetical protein